MYRVGVRSGGAGRGGVVGDAQTTTVCDRRVGPQIHGAPRSGGGGEQRASLRRRRHCVALSRQPPTRGCSPKSWHDQHAAQFGPGPQTAMPASGTCSPRHVAAASLQPTATRQCEQRRLHPSAPSAARSSEPSSISRAHRRDVGGDRPVDHHRRARARGCARAPRAGRARVGAAAADRGPAPRTGARSRGRCARGRAICASLSAACAPIDTWSSRPADDGIESTDAGWPRILFSRHQRRRGHLRDHEARVEPARRARGTAAARVDRCGLTSCSTRRSLMLASSATAIAAKSSASATGWPWKLPPEIDLVAVVADEDERVVGHARRLALEHAAHVRRARRASRRGPAACSGASRGPGPCRSRGATRRSRCRRAARAGARADARLPGVRARRVEALVERARRALERLERHRAGDVGDARSVASASRQRERADARS